MRKKLIPLFIPVFFLLQTATALAEVQTRTFDIEGMG